MGRGLVPENLQASTSLLFLISWYEVGGKNSSMNVHCLLEGRSDIMRTAVVMVIMVMVIIDLCFCHADRNTDSSKLVAVGVSSGFSWFVLPLVHLRNGSRSKC